MYIHTVKCGTWRIEREREREILTESTSILRSLLIPGRLFKTSKKTQQCLCYLVALSTYATILYTAIWRKTILHRFQQN